MKTNTEKFLYTRGLEKQVQSLLAVRKQLEQSQWDVEFLKGEITHLKEFMKYNHEELLQAKQTIKEYEEA